MTRRTGRPAGRRALREGRGAFRFEIHLFTDTVRQTESKWYNSVQ